MNKMSKLIVNQKMVSDGIILVWNIIVLLSALHSSLGAIHPRPPLITTEQSASREFLIDDDQTGKIMQLTLECEAEGEPPPKFRWTKDEKNFEWKKLADKISWAEGSGTLLFFNLSQLSATGTYQCFAYNKWGTATSNPIVVRKAELNSFNKTGPRHFRAKEGHPFKLPCNPPKGYPKPSVHWIMPHSIRFGGILGRNWDTKEANSPPNSPLITPDPEGNLWFSDVKFEHNSITGFNYVCIVQSGVNSVRQTFKLDVSPSTHPPSPRHPFPLYTSDHNTIALSGSNTSLWCIVSGLPTPNITWSKSNGTLEHHRVEFSNYGKTLRIQDVHVDDEGEYTCRARNSMGLYVNSVALQVHSPPYFIREPQIEITDGGRTVQLRCEAGGKPKPELRWIHNGNYLEEETAHPGRVVRGNTILIENVGRGDNGNYGCKAINAHGSVYKEVYLNLNVAVAEGPKPEVIQINASTETPGGEITTDVLMPKSNDEWFSLELLIQVGVAAVAVLLLVTIIIFCLRRKPRRHVLKNVENHDKIQIMSAIADEVLKGKLSPRFEIDKSEFSLGQRRILGMGNFGIVYQDVVRGIPVAVKSPHHDNCSNEVIRGMLCEVKVLAHLGSIHRNIVGFVGCYTKEIGSGVIYIATELCERGSLQAYLRNELGHADCAWKGTEMVAFNELLRFSLEIASGMEYISQQKVVHGDLSTRNVLLDGDLTCKIGDFGLSRKLYEYTKYVKESQEPLPWRWLAYESLMKMEFTTKSDVWSYGVTLWEIFSLGGIPYPGLAWTVQFTEELRMGLRMSCPPFATEEIFERMKCCWNLEPGSRPGFLELKKFLQQYRQQLWYTELGCK